MNCCCEKVGSVRVEVGTVDGCFEADDSLAGTVFEVPEDAFAVERGGEEIAAAVGPADGLHCSGMASHYSRQAAGFHVEDDHCAVYLHIDEVC